MKKKNVRIKFTPMIVLLAMLGTLGLASCGKDKPTTSSQEQVSSESSSSSSSSSSAPSSSTSTSTSSSSSSSTTSSTEPSKEVFSVTFDPLDGKMAGETTISVEDGKMVTKPSDPIKIGYKFIEWQYNGEAYDFSKPVTKSITLVASYDVDNKTYTIRFNTDGGSDVESITGLKRNETGSAPATVPTKEGFEFEAWQYNGKIYTFTEPVTSNITLVARWKVAKFNVTFNTNGGSLVATQSVEYGRKATMPATPTKENATFVGWYVKGTDVEFDFDTPVKEAISLEARWINSYTVTFLNPDASLTDQKVITFITKENTNINEQYQANSDIVSPSSGYSHEKYWKFLGWYIEGKEEKFDPTMPITENITVYAKWDKYYYVAFSESDYEEIVVHEGDYATRPADKADKYGHPFDEWYYSGEVFDFENTPITSNMVLTARYKYFLKFNTTGGSTIEQQVIGYGKYGTQPDDPTRAHYYFVGWYNSGREYNFEASAITGDITLTARWLYVFNGDGTKDSPYLLENDLDVTYFSKYVNSDAQDSRNGVIYKDAYYKLANDITLASEFTPVDGFNGTFDGSSHKISNININTNGLKNVGFFGSLNQNSVVKNLTLDNVVITGTKASNANIGLFAGMIDNAMVYGISVNGEITLNQNLLERAVIGGLAGYVSESDIYACKVTAVINGGNLVGGIAGYVQSSSNINSVYVTENSKLQLYRTGSKAGLVGYIDSTSYVISSISLAKLVNSIYTSQADSKTNELSFNNSQIINCGSTKADLSAINWNEEDWNTDDYTLKNVPDTHNKVRVSFGHMANGVFTEDDFKEVEFGSKTTFDPVEGPAGYVFSGYKVNGKKYDENAIICQNLQLVASYESYENMLGEWKYSDTQWFKLSVSGSGSLMAQASVYNGLYDTTGSNFETIGLTYKESKIEELQYVTYNSYGEASITGKFYNGVVIYFTSRSATVGSDEQEYRLYLQRVNVLGYDKAFMRLEHLNKNEWELTIDKMLTQNTDFTGYFVNKNNSSEKLLVKAPYIYDKTVYDSPVTYEAATATDKCSYNPFLYMGIKDHEDGVYGFTLLDSRGNSIAEYIYLEETGLVKIYDYDTAKEVSINLTESFEYMNARWFDEQGGWDYVYSDENTLDFNAKDPIHVYEMPARNHMMYVDEEAHTITIDGVTYPYEKTNNEEGVATLSFTDNEGTTYNFWADYEYNYLLGLSYSLTCQKKTADGVVSVEHWENYDFLVNNTWVESAPEAKDKMNNIGEIKVTKTQIKVGNHDYVDYDYVFITDCDGIPGMEITTFSYMRFILDDTTYYVRQYKYTGYLMFYYEDPDNAGHLISKRFEDLAGFKYWDKAYDGAWIATDQSDEISIDVPNKLVNNEASFTYSWYIPTEADQEILGYNTRFYNRVIEFTLNGVEYQFRATYVRYGYGYLFSKQSDGTYKFVKEYFGRNILDKLVGNWTYYTATSTETITVKYTKGQGYTAIYNGEEMEASLAWNSYSALPVISYRVDNGEKIELIHLVYSGEYGYDLMYAYDYDSYDAIYDSSSEDMVYEYTTKYLYFKDTTIKSVIEQMSGTWTNGEMTVTIKSDEIYVTEPDFDPATLSIYYIYDLPNSLMDQYVVIMMGVDKDGNVNYMFYYYHHYLSATHATGEETTTGGSLIKKEDTTVFNGDFVSLGINESHSFHFDGTNLSVDDKTFDVDYVTYGYAQLTDGRIVPYMTFDDIVDLNQTTMTAIVRQCTIYYIDGVLDLTLTDTYVTIGSVNGSIGIVSYDKVINILEDEIFYDSNLISYNGLYEIKTTTGNVYLALNDGYVYINGAKIEASITLLADNSLQVVFEYANAKYYLTAGINAFGELVYSVYQLQEL